MSQIFSWLRVKIFSGLPVSVPPLVPDVTNAENHSSSPPHLSHCQSLFIIIKWRGRISVQWEGCVWRVSQGSQQSRQQMQWRSQEQGETRSASQDQQQPGVQAGALALPGHPEQVVGEGGLLHQDMLERGSWQDHLGQEGQQAETAAPALHRPAAGVQKEKVTSLLQHTDIPPHNTKDAIKECKMSCLLSWLHLMLDFWTWVRNCSLSIHWD